MLTDSLTTPPDSERLVDMDQGGGSARTLGLSSQVPSLAVDVAGQGCAKPIAERRPEGALGGCGGCGKIGGWEGWPGRKRLTGSAPNFPVVVFRLEYEPVFGLPCAGRRAAAGGPATAVRRHGGRVAPALDPRREILRRA
jgi:hypothetical protein